MYETDSCQLQGHRNFWAQESPRPCTVYLFIYFNNLANVSNWFSKFYEMPIDDVTRESNFPITRGNWVEVLGCCWSNHVQNQEDGVWKKAFFERSYISQVPKSHFPQASLKKRGSWSSAESEGGSVSRASIPYCSWCSTASKLIKVHESMCGVQGASAAGGHRRGLPLPWENQEPPLSEKMKNQELKLPLFGSLNIQALWVCSGHTHTSH